MGDDTCMGQGGQGQSDFFMAAKATTVGDSGITNEEIADCTSIKVFRKVWAAIKIEKRDLKQDKHISSDKKKIANGRWKEIEGYYRNCIIKDIRNAQFIEFKWALERLFVRNKKGKIVKFILNGPQIKISKAIFKQIKAEKPIRIVLLKARQFGGSTLIEAIQYLWTKAFEGTQYYVISNDTPSARHLYRMFDTYWQYDPHHKERKYTKIGLEYKDCGTRVDLDSGYKGQIGRGFTLFGLHISEIAYFREAATSILSLLQTVPDEPLSIVVFESTANGVGDYFHGLWTRKGDEYERVFIGWWEHDEYKTIFSSLAAKREFEETLDNYEKAGVAEFGWSTEQLNWRRRTIKNKCNGDEEQFMQEYPATAEEAFLSSGRSVFSGSIINHIKVRIETYKKLRRTWRGELTINVDRNDISKYEFHFVSMRNGRLTVFEKPRLGHYYAMGVDVSEGREIEQKGKRDTDNSAITLYDYGGYPPSSGTLPNRLKFRDGEESPTHEVLSWYGKCTTDELAYYIHRIAVNYNMANVALEANTIGQTTLILLVKHLKYPYLYRAKSYDKLGMRGGSKVGWYTTRQTRNYLIDEFCAEIRNDKLWMLSDEFIEEAPTFIVNKSGKKEAQVGHKDDKILSAAIAWQAVKEMPRRKSEAQRHGSEIDQRIADWKKIDKLKKGQSYKGMNVL